MSFLESAFVLPMWQVILVLGFLMTVICVLGGILFMFITIPEACTMFKAKMFKRYVLFEHSSYSKARLTAVKIGEASLEPSKKHTVFRPRHKDDVERTQSIDWIHCHDFSPFPVSSTTALIVDRFISEMRRQGLDDSVSNIDALLRCRLDETEMVGYFDGYRIDEEVLKGDDGKPIMETVKSPDGTEIVRAKMIKKQVQVKYQSQITDEEMRQLADLKEKLETAWIGVDTGGADIFAFNYLCRVANIGISGTNSDLEDLKSSAERHTKMSMKGESRNYFMYGIVVVMLAIGAGVFLKIAGFA